MEAISNPQHDESSHIVAAVATVTSVAVLTVAARLYVRGVMIRSFGWDDIIMALTTVFSITGFALAVVQAQNGAGRHRGDVPPDVYQYGMLVNFVNQPIYMFAICFVKLAVGSSLLRIAVEKSYRWLIMGIMGFMLFYTIACFLTIMLQCSDVKMLWNPTVEATCWDARTIEALSYTNSTLNILTDILFSVVIPPPMLWKLRVNRKIRITLLCVLSLGVFACAAAAVKVSFLTNYGKKGDFLWDSRNITIWTATELNVAITAASLPCLKPLFKPVLRSTYGRVSRDASHSQNFGRKSWHALTELKLRSATDTIREDTESQATCKLGPCDVRAFVHDKTTTRTDISHGSANTREEDYFEVSTSPSDSGSNIRATTVMSVLYSKG